ncbi:MAG: HTH domain-containing protein [Chitinophagaceae bacterium]|nr:HTH domain-containing protein [Chitinophagaceae bacterium]MCW5928482.1 HTH domain-containing protein [Chitinophagaceae bacterium]
MNIKNKLLKGGHLSEKKCLEILQLFSEDLTATEIADASKVSRVTINNYCRLIRSEIVDFCERRLGENRIRTGNNVPANGLQTNVYYGFYQHEGDICTEWLKNIVALPSAKELHTAEEFVAYDAVADCGRWKMHWILKNKEDLSGSQEDVATFWMFTKARLQKFRGMNKNTMYLHIKECEFRYNHRDHNLYAVLMDIIKNKQDVKRLAEPAGECRAFNHI